MADSIKPADTDYIDDVKLVTALESASLDSEAYKTRYQARQVIGSTGTSLSNLGEPDESGILVVQSEYIASGSYYPAYSITYEGTYDYPPLLNLWNIKQEFLPGGSSTWSELTGDCKIGVVPLVNATTTPSGTVLGAGIGDNHPGRFYIYTYSNHKDCSTSYKYSAVGHLSQSATGFEVTMENYYDPTPTSRTVQKARWTIYYEVFTMPTNIVNLITGA